MHGIIGQLATDPVRLAIAVLAVIAFVAIVRCLSGLAFFHSRPEPDEGLTGSPANRASTSIEE